MKEITTENFNYSNLREWVGDWSQSEMAKLAIYCAGLVAEHHENDYDIPNQAVQAVKDWVQVPSEENKGKCRVLMREAFAVGSVARCEFIQKSQGNAVCSAIYAAAAACATAANTHINAYNACINAALYAVKSAGHASAQSAEAVGYSRQASVLPNIAGADKAKQKIVNCILKRNSLVNGAI